MKIRILLGAPLVLLVACAPAGADAAPSHTTEIRSDTLPGVVHPGAPGEPARDTSVRSERIGHTPADVRFMQDMIHHHAQALEMVRLVPERSERPDIRLLARRIEAAQADEIALMRRWLRQRDEYAPDPLAHHREDAHAHRHRHPEGQERHDHAGMAGMLSAEQMDRLSRARGETFDRLFLEYMIFHHEGAIEMVHALFADPHGGQGTEVFRIASHVQADQGVEIERMRGMLAGIR